MLVFVRGVGAVCVYDQPGDETTLVKEMVSDRINSLIYHLLQADRYSELFLNVMLVFVRGVGAVCVYDQPGDEATLVKQMVSDRSKLGVYG
ncbi:hypothetical protein Bca101_099326 [Brassica carinata]